MLNTLKSTVSRFGAKPLYYTESHDWAKQAKQRLSLYRVFAKSLGWRQDHPRTLEDPRLYENNWDHPRKSSVLQLGVPEMWPLFVVGMGCQNLILNYLDMSHLGIHPIWTFSTNLLFELWSLQPWDAMGLLKRRYPRKWRTAAFSPSHPRQRPPLWRQLLWEMAAKAPRGANGPWRRTNTRGCYEQQKEHDRHHSHGAASGSVMGRKHQQVEK